MVTQHAEKIAQAVAIFMRKPFSNVESDGFRSLIKTLSLHYVLLSCKQLNEGAHL